MTIYIEATIYIPAIYNASQPTPLVFNFHGLTGNSTIVNVAC